MADTLTFILDYLDKQKLSKAADALREEIKHKEKAFPGSPRLQPTANDLDVSLVLKLSQDAAQSSLLSESSTASQDSSTPPLQHSPSSLLPENNHFAADSSASVTVLKDPPHAAKSHGGAVEADRVDAPQKPEAGDSVVPVHSPKASQGRKSPSTTDSMSNESTPPKPRSPLAPLPVAEPVASSSPDNQDLPQLRPIRLGAGIKSPSSGSSKLQPLPEVDGELEDEEEEEDEEEADEEDEDEEDEAEDDDDEEVEVSDHSKAVAGPAKLSSEVPDASTPGPSLGNSGNGTKKQEDSAGGTSERNIGVVVMGDVVMDSQVLSSVEGSSVGVRKPRASVSMLNADQEDSQSVVSLSTDGAVAASEAQDSQWDSDTYDDEDDPGYTRQPIEDEEWFLQNEIEYPTEEDPLKAEQEAFLQLQAKNAEAQKAAAPAADSAAASTDPVKKGGTKASSRTEEVKPELIPEEEVYFSGEEYYQQPTEGEDERTPDSTTEEGTWDGVLGEFCEDKGRKHGKKGKTALQDGPEAKKGEETEQGVEEDGDEEEADEDEDEQLMFEARSVGVMSSDMADAGSSIRESVLGSEGDGDSVKGASVMSKSRLGRQGGDEDDTADDEGVDSFEGSPAGSKEVGLEVGAVDEGTEGSEDVVPGKEDHRKSKSLDKTQKRSGTSFIERTSDATKQHEFGFRSLSEVMPDNAGEPGGGGFGGGGFSFPSPSSHDGLSRMGSGRSMFSTGDDGKALADLAAGEELDALGSAADDTLAAWKRHSASSSPMLLSPTKGSDEGRGSSEHLELSLAQEQARQVKEEEVRKKRESKTAQGRSVEEVKEAEVAVVDPELSTLVEPKEKQGQAPTTGMAEATEKRPSGGAEMQVEDAAKKEGAKKEEKGNKESKENKTGAESEEFETFTLKIIHRKNRTGFEEEKDFPVVLNSVIAGRYYVTEYLGSAAFSKAIQAHDLHTGMDVCLKIIKNNKDFFDQSLDEVKLLKYVNRHDPADEHHVLRLFDYFYHREHLFIICELLRANLYEFQKYNRDSGGEVYFTMPRLQKIAKQVLDALKFMHSLGLIHCDLKPENILIKSYSRCEVKVIDLGSSCFETDHLCTYVQSRSYRAPEVILGLPYGPKIDIWSLGCILAELCSGQVLFQNDSLATLLARVVGIIGPIDPQLLRKGRERHKFFTKNHMLYERNPETEQLEYLVPKRTTLRHRVPMGDPGFIEFVSLLLTVDPEKRPTAAEALNHSWLQHQYDTPV